MSEEAMPTGIIMTISDPVAGADAEYDDWYQNVHLPQVCQIPGVLSAQRFRLVDSGAAMAPTPGNVAVYQVSGDPREILDEMAQRARNGSLDMNAALDQATLSISLWSSNGPPVSR